MTLIAVWRKGMGRVESTANKWPFSVFFPRVFYYSLPFLICWLMHVLPEHSGSAWEFTGATG